jgi:hypothetical protein
MNTVSRFKAGLARLHGFADKAGRDPEEITIALRVLTGPGTRPRRSIEDEAEMFTGGDADWVNDIQELAQLGISAVDVRLFGYGADQSLDGSALLRMLGDGCLQFRHERRSIFRCPLEE